MFDKIKSHAKINLALNIIGKSKSLHKIESIVAFVALHDEIYIKKINKQNHQISFLGKFSKNINSKNTISKLLKILDDRNLLKKKFQIKIIKKIPLESGLGGGSMNAASILRYLLTASVGTLILCLKAIAAFLSDSFCVIAGSPSTTANIL